MHGCCANGYEPALDACLAACLPQPLLSIALQRHAVSVEAVQMTLSLALPAAQCWVQVPLPQASLKSSLLHLRRDAR